ncbi:acyl-CoA dehydrogenase family protein [Parasphingorhabdus sp.]|uniref:acyl-CoA dehydrogenase family protein n=1 Tax=Parasphingorhabdus sp. TaxID=2709688 RepID=UPI003A94B87C
MELGLSEEQTLLQDVLRQLCEDRFPLETLRQIEADPDGFPRAFWQDLCELGVPGIAIAERFGGLAMGLLESALVHEQLGRHLVPTPHFTSSILAAQILAESGDEAACSRLLPGIADASLIVSVASAEPGISTGIEHVSTVFERSAGGVRICGTKYFVPFATIADQLLVIGRDRETGTVVAAIVPREAQGVAIRVQKNLATEPYFQVSFKDVTIPDEGLIQSGANIVDAWHAAMFRGLVVLAAQAVGAARRVHEISTAYAKEREAFGRPIGGFQSIAHYLADALVEIEGCQTLVYQAGWLHDNRRAFEAAAAIAKLQSCAMFRQVSALGIQVHGGLGYTTEADPQLFFRRAKQWQLLNWDDTYLEDQIARLTIDSDVADV